MTFAFYIAAIIAIVGTLRVITASNAVHALLYLVVSFLAMAVIFFILGAPFAAVLEVIIYAGAIMVLFIFVIMMLNPESVSISQNKQRLSLRTWAGPVILTVILAAEMIWVVSRDSGVLLTYGNSTPKEVGMALFGSYLPAVEMASILLLAALVGACHLGRRKNESKSDTGDKK